MSRNAFWSTTAALGCFLVAGLAVGSPIYLKAGQCVIIGTQEVCAMTPDTAAPNKSTSDVVHICRYALNPGAEIPNLKNYAVVRITTTASGSKTEAILKQFGISDSDKVLCDAEVEKLNAVTTK